MSEPEREREPEQGGEPGHGGEPEGPGAPGGAAATPAGAPAMAGIFRREAIEHQARPQHEGHLLHLTPAWTLRAYWLLVIVCAVSLVFVVVGRVNEYAAGPAIVKLSSRTDVTARAAAVVESVAVRPGQRVAAHDVLVRLYIASEAAELHRIEHEFELQLVRLLRDPGDQAARTALTTLRAQRELAQARLEERTVRAPHAGVVSDIRIQPGQQLQPGDFIATLVRGNAGFHVTAVLPGQYRPLLRRGMPLRLELQGYPYAYQRLTIDTVGDEVVGPSEIRRYLGQVKADTIQGQGALVVVEARLASNAFVADGRELAYYDGMPATVEVPVRSESVLVTLIPALRAVLEYADGGGT